MAEPKALIVPRRVAERFWSNVSVRHPGDCWPWTRGRRDNGYGSLGWSVGSGKVRTVLAHRVAYTLAVGRIPDGMTIDHICRVRHCCNPAHLRVMTHSENSSRNGWALKTHCPRGHEYTPENTGRDRRGGRYCVRCSCLRARESQLRAKAPTLTERDGA